MTKVRCLLTYRRYSNKNLINFCSLVSSGVYTNVSVFPTPTIALVDFTTTLTKYSDAVAKYENAPKIEKTNMENARKNMLTSVDILREYVDGIANGDASTINLAGYMPSKSDAEKSKPVEVTNNFTLKRTDLSGQAEVTISYTGTGTPQWYFAICSTEGTLPSTLVENGILNFEALPEGVRVDLSKSKKKLFTNLDSGVTYYFYVLVANNVNVSPLSDPRSLVVF
jgi:hypothetical protein